MGDRFHPSRARFDPPAPLVSAGLNLFMDALALQVLEALKTGGVRAILLKGPSIARWLYDNAASRNYADTDLLVSPADVGRAESILAELGYKHEGLDPRPHDPPWDARYWTRSGDGAAVDLHRTLTGIGGAPERVWELLSGETEVMWLQSTPVEVLDEPARALNVVLHAADHGVLKGKPLVDLGRALERVTDGVWAEAADLARRLDATSAFAAGLGLSPAGRELAERLSLSPNRSVSAALRASEASRFALGIEWLASLHGVRAKLTFLLHELVPSVDFMRSSSRLAAQSNLGLAVAYVWRPVLLLAHAVPALWAWSRARGEVRGR